MRPALVLLLALSPVHAAPAPAEPDPRERLEALHKQLLATVTRWLSDYPQKEWEIMAMESARTCVSAVAWAPIGPRWWSASR